MSNGCTLCRHDMKLFHQKTVVGVDRPVNALTCKQKEEKLSKFS